MQCLEFWGGPENNFNLWHKIEFSFEDFEISPNERFVITFSGNEGEEEKEKKEEEKKEVKKDEKGVVKKEEKKEEKISRPDNVFIWDIMKNEIVRSYYIDRSEKFQNLKFSYDSKYLARIKKDVIIVYVSPEMGMLPVDLN